MTWKEAASHDASQLVSAAKTHDGSPVWGWGWEGGGYW